MRCFWPLAGILSAVIGYALYEPCCVSLTQLDLPFKNLPKELDGFKILHLTDLHTTKYGLLENRTESIISSLDYDLCVITGDLCTSPEAVTHIRRMFGPTVLKSPVYIVPGNSEYKPWSDTGAILQACKSHGFLVLLNSGLEVNKNNVSFKLIGMDDAYSGMHDIATAFSSVNNGEFVVALSHCPSIADELIRNGASLVLSGHTHGGQIRIPGIGVLWSHMRHNWKLNDGYYSSEILSDLLNFDVGESKLFVNRGLGTSRIHLRLNCRPEIALLTLRAI